MTLYEQISKLGGYFNSLRLHEGLLVVDLKLPIEWKVKEIVGSRGNKIQLQEGSKSKTQKIISFFSSFDEQESEILEEEVLAVIKWNKEREEKQLLLQQKMVELEKVFHENDINSLRNLDINFKTSMLNLNGETKIEPLVREGNGEGPEGNTSPQE
tara:strand:+ start:771 stop:1238 length:468 start_codon:yes stop_codon:yes gene_type:complete